METESFSDKLFSLFPQFDLSAVSLARDSKILQEASIFSQFFYGCKAHLTGGMISSLLCTAVTGALPDELSDKIQKVFDRIKIPLPEWRPRYTPSWVSRDLACCILGPIQEEVVMLGLHMGLKAIQQLGERSLPLQIPARSILLSPGLAIACTQIVFGLLHAQQSWRQALHASMSLGSRLRYITGYRIWAPLGCHILNNTLVCLLIHFKLSNRVVFTSSTMDCKIIVRPIESFNLPAEIDPVERQRFQDCFDDLCAAADNLRVAHGKLYEYPLVCYDKQGNFLGSMILIDPSLTEETLRAMRDENPALYGDLGPFISDITDSAFSIDSLATHPALSETARAEVQQFLLTSAQLIATTQGKDHLVYRKDPEDPHSQWYLDHGFVQHEESNLYVQRFNSADGSWSTS